MMIKTHTDKISIEWKRELESGKRPLKVVLHQCIAPKMKNCIRRHIIELGQECKYSLKFFSECYHYDISKYLTRF